MVTAPDPQTLPTDHHLVLSRGPYRYEDECALLEEFRIDALVTKNSGGAMTRAKLDAARDCGVAVIMIDRPALPAGAEVFAIAASGEPMIFGIGTNCLGFVGHPGAKRGMMEDLIMEFAETPEDTAGSLQLLGQVQSEIAEALTSLMVGVAGHTGLM